MDKTTPERLRIKDWEENDRPREKMIYEGRKSLSNTELLAILIGSGNSKESAVDLSQRILKSFDNKLSLLAKATITELTEQFHGIGAAKAVSILAALELGRRLSYEYSTTLEDAGNSTNIYNLIKPEIQGNSEEEAWAIFINAGCKIIRKKKISEGGISSCTVDIRIIIREALYLKASGVILIHNHPSGDVTPSKQDKDLTHKLYEACKLCDMALLDHMIVTDNNYYSFHDEKILR